MSGKRVVGIVMYGEIKENKDIWKDWLIYTKSVSDALDYKLTHYGVECDSLKGDGVKTLSRSGKKLLEAINNYSDLRFYPKITRKGLLTKDFSDIQ